MALIKCDFFSETLAISTSMMVILPEQSQGQIGMAGKKRKGAPPVLYLLHGYSDDETTWSRRTSIERYASEYGIAVIMPNVEHSYYADMVYGKKYWTFLTKELPAVVHQFFKLSDKKEDTFVAGLSMGGYGAFKWALADPDKFAAAASLSGVLDLASRYEETREEQTPMAESLYYAFGKEGLKNTNADLISRLHQNKDKLPFLYLACGTEDFLIEENKTFIETCKKLDLSIDTDLEPGTHEWGFWDKQIQKVLNWLPIR